MVDCIRFLGFKATLHTATASDLDYLLLCSGLGDVNGRNGSSIVSNPYLGDQFGMAVVSTTMELAADKPLSDGLGETDHGVLSCRDSIAAGSGTAGYPAQEDSHAKIQKR